MNHENIAKQILEKVGGEKNVNKLNHCATRLRFSLAKMDLADIEGLKNINGVISSLVSGGEIHVVIGVEVPSVYKQIISNTNIREGAFIDDKDTTAIDNKEMGKIEKSSENILNKLVGLISSTFTPLIPAFIGAGMVFAIAVVLSRFGILSENSATYSIFVAIGTSAFYFLPIYVSITLAKRLDANPYIAALISASLLTPSFVSLVDAGGDQTLFGIPLMLVSYGSTIVPSFVATIIYSKLEKFLNSIFHANLRLVFVPMLSLIIMVPLTILVFGPFGIFMDKIMSGFINAINDFSSILLGVVIGGGNFILIIFGLGWILVPMQLANLAAGGDPILAMLGAMNFAIFGVAFGVYLKTKDPITKGMAASATLTGVLAGISEPTLYGIVLRYRRTIPMLMLSGAIGGAIIGASGSKALGYSFQNIFTFANYHPMVGYIIGCTASFIISTVLIYLFGYESKKGVANNSEGE